MKTIIFTGGGSGGRMIQHLPDSRNKKNYSETKIVYLGGIKSIEEKLFQKLKGLSTIPFKLESFVDISLWRTLLIFSLRNWNPAGFYYSVEVFQKISCFSTESLLHYRWRLLGDFKEGSMDS